MPDTKTISIDVPSIEGYISKLSPLSQESDGTNECMNQAHQQIPDELEGTFLEETKQENLRLLKSTISQISILNSMIASLNDIIENYVQTDQTIAHQFNQDINNASV